MTPTSSTTPTATLAAASAALVQPYDIVDIATGILTDAVATCGAASGGIILRRLGQDHLSLLTATSHQAQELELYQTQIEQGPCFDAVETGAATSAAGSEIQQRWPQIGPAFAQAGYVRAHATPLIWHTDTIGALNVFWATEPATVDHHALQAFADLTTLAIVHAAPVTTTAVMERIRSALSQRNLLEQVKGVLAHQRGITPEQAYDVLVSIAAHSSESLLDTATRLLKAAESPS